ncbi:MAG TPA: hypothetical protein VGK67_39935 [Myxococcales bacterium]|jgi:hypothetical protein
MALHRWGFGVFAALATTALAGCGGCGTDPAGEVDAAGERPDARQGKADGNEVCIPTTCLQLQANCGFVDDGCGVKIECGSCDTGTCGGGGTPNQCGWTNPDTGSEPPDADLVEPPDADLLAPADAGGPQDAAAPGSDAGGGEPDVGFVCAPKNNCGAMGFNCGPVGDGCGGLAQCGNCGGGGVCGGAGEPNVCSTPQVCVRKTCNDYPSKTCGPVSDGCGGMTEDCGGCTDPETCGGGGTPSLCGSVTTCVPKTCGDYPLGSCGRLSDGCGDLTADCGGCTWPKTCGGGGVASECGGGPPPCTPKTCGDFPAGTCGQVDDACGGLTTLCGTCVAPDTCGGGGVASLCGGGVPPCVPKTCADFPAGACGPLSDGCGGLTAVCGTCPSTQTCGGGGVPSVCFGPLPCTAKVCGDFPAGTCGRVADGCGGLTADCGGCSILGDTCGGGGIPSRCGGAPPACTKKTCTDYSAATCGQVSDGCGGLTVDCGGCAAPDTCGGGGVPSECGGGGGTTCINLECKQTVCPGTGTTSISGVVYDPAGLNPLYNVFVFVPNGTPAAFPNGATCDKCADALSGYPLVTTVTDEKGAFKLTNVPVGTNIPVVIQTGKWRRQIKVNTQACVDVPIAATLTRLPRNKSEGDIPKIALNTGGFDTLECLLRKVGIDDSEFTNPSGTGRINLYRGRPLAGFVSGGQVYTFPAVNKYSSALGGASFPDSTALWNDLATLKKYDVVLTSCEGATYGDPSERFGYTNESGTKSAQALGNMQDYANQGGRVFASHFNYYWITANTSGAGAAQWSSLVSLSSWPGARLVNKLSSTTFSYTVPEKISMSFTKGDALAKWLLNVGASPAGLGNISINEAKNSISSFDSTRLLEWVYADNMYLDPTQTSGVWTLVAHAPEYLSFNTPVEYTATQPANQCGRFVFSDIHVSSGDVSGYKSGNQSVAYAFPDECKTTTLSAQEKALEFMLFDLSSRVCDDTVPPEPPVCIPRTCADQGIECGPAPDGCGNIIPSCGTCPSPQVCATGGKCGGSSCTPTTCAAQGKNCGSWPNGCGGILDCGNCVSPKSCGGEGLPGVCGGGVCTPTTCAALDLLCGQASNGCGGTLDCGTCPSPYTCAGSGIVGRCGGAVCTPTTCAALGMNCGQASDGCGGTLACGTCTPPQTCGGGGIVGRCGGNGCTPTTCSALGVECGEIADGCGSILQCGDCVAPDTCGGGGILGRCGGGCTPATCGTLGYACGFWSDGCGGTLACGTCNAPKRCGGGGVLGACGGGCVVAGDACATAGVTCGPAPDGCGGLVNCGPCSTADGGVATCTPMLCGGRCGLQGDGCGGTLSCLACPPSGCVPTTCAVFGAQCGRIPDGCGGVLECGSCDAGACGGGGQPFRCGP